jgi:hypothetical protein
MLRAPIKEATELGAHFLALSYIEYTITRSTHPCSLLYRSSLPPTSYQTCQIMSAPIQIAH